MTCRLVRTQCARPARAGRLALGTSVALVPKPGVIVRNLRESDRAPIAEEKRRNPPIYADCGALRSVLTPRLPCRRSRVRVPSSASKSPAQGLFCCPRLDVSPKRVPVNHPSVVESSFVVSSACAPLRPSPACVVTNTIEPSRCCYGSSRTSNALRHAEHPVVRELAHWPFR